MTTMDFISRWQARLDEYRRLGILADASRLCEEMLADFRAVQAAQHDRPLTIAQATLLTNRSRSTIERWLADGKIENVGRRGSPRVRYGDVSPFVHSDLEGVSDNAHTAHADARTVAARLTGGRHAS